MNDICFEASATSQVMGGTYAARLGRSAVNDGASDAASPRGGWTPSRASWFGMAAVIVLAAAVLTLGALIAGESSTRVVESASMPSTAIIDTGAEPVGATTSSPTTIASSWSMPPEPLPSETLVNASGMTEGPETTSSSLVYSPR